MAGSMSHAIVIYVGQMDVAHDARHSSSVAGQVRGMGAVSRLAGDDEISPQGPNEEHRGETEDLSSRALPK